MWTLNWDYCQGYDWNKSAMDETATQLACPSPWQLNPFADKDCMIWLGLFCEIKGIFCVHGLLVSWFFFSFPSNKYATVSAGLISVEDVPFTELSGELKICILAQCPLYGGTIHSNAHLSNESQLQHFLTSSQLQHLQRIKNISLLEDLLTTPSVLCWPWWRQKVNG